MVLNLLLISALLPCGYKDKVNLLLYPNKKSNKFKNNSKLLIYRDLKILLNLSIKKPLILIKKLIFAPDRVLLPYNLNHYILWQD